MIFKTLVKSLGKRCVEKAPTILMGVGIAGFIGTCTLFVKETPKVNLMLTDERNEKGDELTKLETAKVGIKGYWPALTMAAVSIACFVTGNFINYKRNLALASAFALSEKALLEYQSMTDDKIDILEKSIERGKKRRKKKAKDAKNDEKTAEIPENLKNSNDCDVWFVDCQSGQGFFCDMLKVQTAVLMVNDDLMDGDTVTLNTLYDYLNSEIGSDILTHIDLGDENGWDYHFDGKLIMHYEPQIDKKGKPYIKLQYNTIPIHYAT